MTKLPLIVLPNKNLRKKSKKVHLIDTSVVKLVEKMEKTTLDWEASREHELGVALAAAQINDLRRVVVIRNNFEDKSDKTFKILINPKITKLEGKVEDDYEGCLSISDIYGLVPRHTKVRVKAQDLNGNEINLKAEGFLARVLQHEIDHTNGIVFIDHIKDSPDSFFRLETDGKLNPLEFDKEIKGNKQLWG